MMDVEFNMENTLSLITLNNIYDILKDKKINKCYIRTTTISDNSYALFRIIQFLNHKNIQVCVIVKSLSISDENENIIAMYDVISELMIEYTTREVTYTNIEKVSSSNFNIGILLPNSSCIDLISVISSDSVVELSLGKLDYIKYELYNATKMETDYFKAFKYKYRIGVDEYRCEERYIIYPNGDITLRYDGREDEIAQ